MSYVDAVFDKRRNIVRVVERTPEGKRKTEDYPCEWSFYYDDPRGKFTTMFGTPVSQFTTHSYDEYQRELRIHSNKKLWESDINIVNKVLEKHYRGIDSPNLNICFFDIEVDFSATQGFSTPDDPFNKITAISLYCTWLETMITLVIPPRGISKEEAEKIAAEFDNCFLFDSEADLIDTFLDLIDDADVLTGWNSEGYDIPYIIRRCERILSKNDTRRFCLFGHYPKKREFEKYGKEQFTFDLVGRVHLDSLNLYQKYTYHEMHSYSLDTIAEYELGERKVQYIGTLDQLYNRDFKKFIDYNRQDTMILKRLDDKLQFISLASEIAHENTVPIPATMGSVGVIEQAIINYAHELGMVVPDRADKDDNFDTRAAGAYVATPKKGLHKYVGAIDINSLYPSAIRALNMSPETIVGQLRPTHTKPFIFDRIKTKNVSFAEAWEGQFGSLEYQYVANRDASREIYVDWKDNHTTVLMADEVHDIVFHSGEPWLISANGTIFRHDKQGIVPGLLEKWYAERKELQAKKKAATDKEEIAFWDKRQLVKKINLNSLYGAILNEYCRFYVHGIGQSTTLTGRCITKHMSAKVNELLAGEYDHTGKTIIYGDTDSVAGDTVINTNEGDFMIEHLFHRCPIKWANGDKEYSVDDIRIATYDHSTYRKILAPINYIYRHKVSKPRWRITDEHGNQIEITDDHSIMVERNDELIEVKPSDLIDTDILITS